MQNYCDLQTGLTRGIDAILSKLFVFVKCSILG